MIGFKQLNLIKFIRTMGGPALIQAANEDGGGLFPTILHGEAHWSLGRRAISKARDDYSELVDFRMGFHGYDSCVGREEEAEPTTGAMEVSSYKFAHRHDSLTMSALDARLFGNAKYSGGSPRGACTR